MRKEKNEIASANANNARETARLHRKTLEKRRKPLIRYPLGSLHEAGLLTHASSSLGTFPDVAVQWLSAIAGLALLSRLQLRGSGGVAPRFPTLHGW
jgi:hypothetical protein